MSGTEYEIRILASAKKDRDRIRENPVLKRKVDSLLSILRQNPWQNPLLMRS